MMDDPFLGRKRKMYAQQQPKISIKESETKPAINTTLNAFKSLKADYRDSRPKRVQFKFS